MMNSYSRYPTHAQQSDGMQSKQTGCLGHSGRLNLWSVAVFIVTWFYDTCIFFIAPYIANIILLQFEYVHAVPLTKETFVLPLACVTLSQSFLFFVLGVYNQRISFLNLDDSRRTFLGLFAGLACVALGLTVFDKPHLRSLVVASFPLTFLCVFYGRLTLNDWLCALRKKYGDPVLIYGAGSLGREMYSLLNSSSKTKLHPVGFVDDDLKKMNTTVTASGLFHCDQLSILGTRADIDRLVRSINIKEVFIAFRETNETRMANVLVEFARMGVAVNFLPSVYKMDQDALEFLLVGGTPVARVVAAPSPRRFFMKRMFDVVITATLLAMLWPIFALLALAVKLDSKGPIIFAHDRVGKDGEPFTMYKFRSMLSNSCPYQVNPTQHCDPRLTRVGRLLRKTSLDELPQLFNVLKGDMSLVGPRPEMQFIVDEYDEEAKRRLQALPGITGLWQISIDRKNAIHENLSYDLYYIRNASVLLDIIILLKTIAFLFRGI